MHVRQVVVGSRASPDHHATVHARRLENEHLQPRTAPAGTDRRADQEQRCAACVIRLSVDVLGCRHFVARKCVWSASSRNVGVAHQPKGDNLCCLSWGPQAVWTTVLYITRRASERASGIPKSARGVPRPLPLSGSGPIYPSGAAGSVPAGRSEGETRQSGAWIMSAIRRERSLRLVRVRIDLFSSGSGSQRARVTQHGSGSPLAESTARSERPRFRVK
jgi:hypothetical protein